MKLSDKPTRDPEVVWRKEDDVVYLFSLKLGEFFKLDFTGGFIWELCDGNASLLDILKEIEKAYDVSGIDEQMLKSDLVGLMKKLKKKGFIRITT